MVFCNITKNVSSILFSSRQHKTFNYFFLKLVGLFYAELKARFRTIFEFIHWRGICNRAIIKAKGGISYCLSEITGKTFSSLYL